MRTFPPVPGARRRSLALALILLIVLVWTAPGTSADAEREKAARTVKTLLASKDFDAAVAYLRERLATAKDPALELLLADALFQAGRVVEACSAVETLCQELDRRGREGKLAADEGGLQKAAWELREKILPGSKEMQDLVKGSVARWLDFARKRVARGDERTARMALRQVEKLDPGNLEAEKTMESLVEIGVRGEWQDLANFKPASTREPKEHPLRLSWPPSFTGESMEVLRNAGFYVPNQKYIYMHTPDDDEGSWAIFKLPGPIQVFQARVAIPHPEKKEGDVVFKVFADGIEVASHRARGGEPPFRLLKRFPACRELKLFVARNGNWHWDDCLWIEPMVK